VERIKGGLLIERETRFLARRELAGMVTALRESAGADAPDEAAISALVDEVRAEHAGGD